jgi:hypothetical protein
MKPFESGDLVSKAILGGPESIKLWLTVCAFGIVMMWAHQQWAGNSRPQSGLRLFLWGILLVGLYLLSSYLDKEGYYSRWMIQLGIK